MINDDNDIVSCTLADDDDIMPCVQFVIFYKNYSYSQILSVHLQ